MAEDLFQTGFVDVSRQTFCSAGDAHALVTANHLRFPENCGFQHGQNLPASCSAMLESPYIAKLAQCSLQLKWCDPGMRKICAAMRLYPVPVCERDMRFSKRSLDPWIARGILGFECGHNVAGEFLEFRRALEVHRRFTRELGSVAQIVV